MSGDGQRAALIVLEGIDGSGKTTLGRRLADAVAAAGLPVKWCPNVNLAPVRDRLDEVARETGYADRAAMLGRDRAQMLAAILKWRDYADLADDMARPGLVMVMDRYFYTHLALALVQRTGNLPRLRRLYAGLPEPRLTLLLEIDPDVAAERVRARGTDSTSPQFLADFAAAYRALPEYGTRFTRVDGARDADAVFADAWAAVELHLPTTAASMVEAR
ncbi:thymidylate kinase [Catellatospora sp. NPDC049111]|uniref:dTMP kinase n=1 Tax=Catellatospora sp. NPDC049111 TaxID=3155271 RepID=UPI0033C78C74